jgi:hypothetical protein
MTKFRTSTVITMADPSTLSILKNACMDFDEILKVTKDISGTPIPEELQERLAYETKWMRSNCWDFMIHEESSWGMKFTIETRYNPDFNFFVYLCYKFPDLRVKIDYSSCDTDGTYDIVFICRTREGKVEIQEAVWDEEYLSGCGYGLEPEFYKRYSPGLLLKKPAPPEEPTTSKKKIAVPSLRPEYKEGSDVEPIPVPKKKVVVLKKKIPDEQKV